MFIKTAMLFFNQESIFFFEIWARESLFGRCIKSWYDRKLQSIVNIRKRIWKATFFVEVHYAFDTSILTSNWTIMSNLCVIVVTWHLWQIPYSRWLVHYTHTSRAISAYHNQTYACSTYGKSFPFMRKSIFKEIVLSIMKPLNWHLDQHVRGIFLIVFLSMYWSWNTALRKRKLASLKSRPNLSIMI